MNSPFFTEPSQFYPEAMASSVISQLVDAMTLCSQPAERQVRTTIDPPMAPEEAMKLLKDRG